jgi:hypothetical protein
MYNKGSRLCAETASNGIDCRERRATAHLVALVIELDRRYTLGYVSSKDGNWRKVEVKVKRPSANRLVVRTWQGPFAPAKEVSPKASTKRRRASREINANSCRTKLARKSRGAS